MGVLNNPTSNYNFFEQKIYNDFKLYRCVSHFVGFEIGNVYQIITIKIN